jgi:hypothetical protein
VSSAEVPVNINPTWLKIGVLAWIVGGVASGTMAEDFKAVPELGYRVNPDFFHGAERLSLLTSIFPTERVLSARMHIGLAPELALQMH